MTTFLKITNKDVYDKLCIIENKMERQTRKAIISFWMASTALTLDLIIIGVLMRWQ